MSRRIDEYVSGQTPLPASWKLDIIPPINTYEELNEHEALNIRSALMKYQFSGRKKWELTDPFFLKKLHKEMYGEVWIGAGEYRLENQVTNIGVDAGKIGSELFTVCRDCESWFKYNSFSLVEIAVRYHHKIVSIHPFPNGNGRFSRFVADLIMISHGGKALSWGNGNLINSGKMRIEYLEALREADLKKYDRLIAFAQSKSDS